VTGGRVLAFARFGHTDDTWAFQGGTDRF